MHTPGFWTLHQDGKTIRGPQVGKTIPVIATVSDARDGPVVALAPELLEALGEAAYLLSSIVELIDAYYTEPKEELLRKTLDDFVGVRADRLIEIVERLQRRATGMPV